MLVRLSDLYLRQASQKLQMARLLRRHATKQLTAIRHFASTASFLKLLIRFTDWSRQPFKTQEAERSKKESSAKAYQIIIEVATQPYKGPSC